MKKIALGAAIALTLGLIGLYAYAFSLPSQWTIESTRLIKAEPATIYGQMELENWQKWSSWGPAGDESAAVEVDDNTLRWTGEKLGEGHLEVTHAVPNERLEYRLWFAGRDDPTQGTIVLTETKGGTEVKWIDRGDMAGNPLLRLLLPKVESQLSDDIERSLIRLDEGL